MKNPNQHSRNQNLLVTLLIFLAALALFIGILIPAFCHYKDLYDSNFIGAFFSLAGVFMFSAALVYQVKEYRLQVEELKKSVEAQTESSKALDQQRQLMVDQNTNDFIFNLIENFNRFKHQPEIHSSIRDFETFYDEIFINLESLKMNKNQQKNAEAFFKILNESFHEWINKYRFKSHLIEFAQFAFIIFDLILGKKNESTKYEFFSPVFNNQFIEEEKLILCLINTNEFDSLYSAAVEWKFHTVVYLLKSIDERKGSCFIQFVDVHELLILLDSKMKSKQASHNISFEK